MDLRACFDELGKLGAISDEQARASLDRLETLRQDAPTPGRIARYAAFGAATAPAVSMLGNVIAGKAPIQAANPGRLSAMRAVGQEAAKGALGAGALPLLQTRLDQHAEIRNLKRYLAQNEAPESGKTASLLLSNGMTVEAMAQHFANRIRAAAGLVPKLAFQTSQFSGPLSYGPFKQESILPNKPPPSLQESPVAKKAGVMSPTGVTPAARLSSSMRVGAPKVTSPSGPSIADISKPHGFGTPAAGAIK